MTSIAMTEAKHYIHNAIDGKWWEIAMTEGMEAANTQFDILDAYDEDNAAREVLAYLGINEDGFINPIASNAFFFDAIPDDVIDGILERNKK